MTDDKTPDKDLNPFLTIFKIVLAELKERMTPEEYTDLLKECQTDE